MKVFIVDDDKIVSSSLKIILEEDPEIFVVATGTSGDEAIKGYERYNPDILLMDIRMGSVSGLEAGEIILSNNSEAKILFLTTFLDDDYIIKALNIGAKGYMLKQDFNSIIPALKAVYMGQNVYGNEIISKLPTLMNRNNKSNTYIDYGITEKEHNIILQIAEGFSNKEIAAHLYLSEGTIRNVISSILEKLELRDRTQIAVDYYKRK
ncbi:response regulator [Alkalibaculum sp. M08DMB]|uniref:Stage 0 sporulation protein A homolog n=1 Tax=Alkalibaculum sporogenes TaxID=2655001 RepID=A0A6A7K8T1_9FIRM|nr:response regulator transcription factor [Alkalibaculum sporogenes]MPW25731.1 response regulator [Alkalibaculum sporogenes]